MSNPYARESESAFYPWQMMQWSLSLCIGGDETVVVFYLTNVNIKFGISLSILAIVSSPAAVAVRAYLYVVRVIFTHYMNSVITAAADDGATFTFHLIQYFNEHDVAVTLHRKGDDFSLPINFSKSYRRECVRPCVCQ